MILLMIILPILFAIVIITAVIFDIKEIRGDENERIRDMGSGTD